MARLAEISLDLRDGKAKRACEASVLAYEATMALYDDVLGGDGGAQSTRGQIRRVLGYIRAHLHEPLEVQTLADLAGLSRAHFTRVFSHSEGVSPAEHILDERMRRAASLLVSGGSLGQAGVARLWFRRSELFREGVSQELGASPTEFRTTGMYAS